MTPSVPARVVRQKPAVSKPCIPRAAAVLTAKEVLRAGPVSFSSRMVAGKSHLEGDFLKCTNILRMKSLAVCPAAYRAVESREKDALFQDPMAESLAGEQAIQQVITLHVFDGIQTVLGACASVSRQHSECSDLCKILC